MFAMNLAAWGDRPVTLGLCEPAELAELRAGMARLLDSPAEGQITWGLHQAAYAAAPADHHRGGSGSPAPHPPRSGALVLRMADRASRAAGTRR